MYLGSDTISGSDMTSGIVLGVSTAVSAFKTTSAAFVEASFRTEVAFLATGENHVGYHFDYYV